MQIVNPFAPTQSGTVSVASGGTGIIIAAGTNVNGIIVSACSFILNSTVATACEAQLRLTGTGYPLLGGRINAGAILAVPFVLERNLFIPAGIGLELQNLVSPANIVVYASIQVL